jgi:hypothetical protein
MNVEPVTTATDSFYLGGQNFANGKGAMCRVDLEVGSARPCNLRTRWRESERTNPGAHHGMHRNCQAPLSTSWGPGMPLVLRTDRSASGQFLTEGESRIRATTRGLPRHVLGIGESVRNIRFLIRTGSCGPHARGEIYTFRGSRCRGNCRSSNNHWYYRDMGLRGAPEVRWTEKRWAARRGTCL